MIEHKLIKVENPEDPHRCQATIRTGQCPWQAVKLDDGSFALYCKVHQGASKAAARPNAVLRNYRLAKWQSRVNEFADNPNVKSLREEIGILRIILEEIVTKCDDSNDLLIYSTKIADYVSKIEKIIVSCHRLEQSSGFLLDKTTIIQLANTIIEIIGQRINDPVILEQISEEIINIITESKTLKDRTNPESAS